MRYCDTTHDVNNITDNNFSGTAMNEQQINSRLRKMHTRKMEYDNVIKLITDGNYFNQIGYQLKIKYLNVIMLIEIWK